MGFISPLIWVVSVFTRLIIPVITTHEPPSKRSCENLGLGQRQQASYTELTQKTRRISMCFLRALISSLQVSLVSLGIVNIKTMTLL